MMSSARLRRRPSGATVLALAVGLAGCKASPPAPAEKPPAFYEMRGVVAQLPAAGSSEMLIHHEAVPGFVDELGKASTMPAMTMPFTPGPGVSFQGLKVGDPVAMTLSVDWPHLAIVVSRISRLPADTVFNFAPPASRP